MTEPHASSATDSALAARVREIEAKLAASETKLAAITAERDRLRRAYQLLLEHYELLRRKLFVAKAERIDATQLEMDERVKGVRGLIANAFGYAVRQKGPLSRFLEDGRLPLTNNHSERALRSPICAGRKAWLFFGSDDHATAAANLFSLVVSCQLHGINGETYLAEMIRIVPLWPRARYLELAPKYWKATRARLDPAELAHELGPLTVPPPAGAEEQRTPS